MSETYIILGRTERDVINMYIGLRVKYPLFSSDFNETWIFWTNFPKIDFMKIRPVGTELFHADREIYRQMDRHFGANNPFLQFCERTEN